MEVKKTNDYQLFKFMVHNRKIDIAHVNRIEKSIKSHNMLEFRPIEVNDDYGIIDGQHRLEAAKRLGVDIYYKVLQDSKTEDVITLNISKNWNVNDFFNYYLKQKYPEYLKLDNYMKSNDLSLKLGLAITSGQNHENSHDFRLGKYKFEGETNNQILDMCHQTIDFIKKMNGFSNYTNTSRFWMALVLLINHAHFSMDKWQFNLARMVHKFGPRANRKDYLDMFMNCYNWKNSNKIDLNDIE